ncbi:MAG TPA: hypothetical protein VJ816_02830 [Gemmatimonadales bacterium]|nr:hypothetical protein [Gemmatimonadales bacterium]
MTGRIFWVIALVASGHQVAAQTELTAAARSGTARYQDRAQAIADGYRAVGPDFPGMGEHWVNTGLLLAGTLDPAQPPVLEYVTIGGHPTLVGVAYAALVNDSAVPTGLPVPASAWHTHAGTVDEESFVLSHAGVHRHHDPGRGPRVAVVHAWIWLDNPDGLFATDNWAVPCARLGFAVPAQLSADAGRALALAAGGTAYFAMLIRIVGAPDSAEHVRLRDVLHRAAVDIARHVGHGTGATPLPADAVPWLEAAWQRTWATLLETASPPVRERFAVLNR